MLEASEALQKPKGIIFFKNKVHEILKFRNNLDKLDWLTPQDL